MARRLELTVEVREQRAAATPLPAFVGSLAGKGNLHLFRDLTHGRGAAQCADCFGWRDDPRHVFARAVANV